MAFHAAAPAFPGLASGARLRSNDAASLRMFPTRRRTIAAFPTCCPIRRLPGSELEVATGIESFGVSLAEAPAFKKAPGGAPANVAVGIARLGGSSAFIGKSAEFISLLEQISEEEISFLTKGEDPYDDAVIRKLFHPNLKLLLVTEGPNGCRYYSKDFSGRVSGLKVEQVDTTGAGDAFVAGILSQLASDVSLLQVPISVIITTKTTMLSLS
ncbi:hypothetical protein GW17_00042810 [Ensete ventricosum]|nr:hypothetical protein GW17_00042810 [Ensete ventricosum]